jgi:NAD(P)-dependent dehydrogenase (short-subunit alcohol dehydrogenase family)
VRVALVTGAGRGIGAAVALRLARGALVVVLDRDGAAAEETAAGIVRGGGTAEPLEADVGDPDGIDAAIDRLVERHGRLDQACNCAGVTGVEERVEDYPTQVFRRVMDVNATGVFACMRAELRHMARQGSGAIVNVGSGAGMLGVPCHSAYAASKHAVAGLTRTAAIEYATAGIRVNAVAPGLVATGLVAGRDTQAFIDAHPIGRPIEASEVAEVVAWLLESAPAALTGAVIPVDGGLTARVPGLS